MQPCSCRSSPDGHASATPSRSRDARGLRGWKHHIDGSCRGLPCCDGTGRIELTAVDGGRRQSSHHRGLGSGYDDVHNRAVDGGRGRGRIGAAAERRFLGRRSTFIARGSWTRGSATAIRCRCAAIDSRADLSAGHLAAPAATPSTAASRLLQRR